jgi:hypothetical protein
MPRKTKDQLPAVEPDPLENAPDVEPTPPGTPEGLETDIPAGGEPDTEAHPAVWPEGSQ